jgi:hypothetical protein
MSKRRSKSARKAVSQAVAQPQSKAPRASPVEKAWNKFVVKFLEFQKVPDNEDDEASHKHWERELQKTDEAAHAVMEKPATCLQEMELKISAWAFTSEVQTGDTLASLVHWQPNNFATNSDLIASLRDDVRFIRRLICSAGLAVSSIGVTPACWTALPALSLPVEAADSGYSPAFVDLASRFEAISTRFFAQLAIDQQQSDEIDAAITKATGLTRDQWPHHRDPGFEDHMELVRKIGAEFPDDDDSIAWNEIDGELDPLGDIILTQTPHTLADLALQARAVAIRRF